MQHPRVLYLLGHAIWTQSEFSNAQPHLEQALEAFRQNNDHVGQRETLVALANSALINSRFDESRELLREALSFDIPAVSLVQIHGQRLGFHIPRRLGEADRHLGKVFEMVESGVGVSNPLATQLILFSEGAPGYVDKLDKLCAVMRQRLIGPPDLSHATYHLLNGAVLLYRGCIVEADREHERALKIGRDCGQITMIAAALCTSFAIAAAAQGRWADMEAHASEGLGDTKYGQITRNWRLHFLCIQARARWHSGNFEGLHHTYENAMQPIPSKRPPRDPSVSHSRHAPAERTCLCTAGRGFPRGAARGRAFSSHPRHFER